MYTVFTGMPDGVTVGDSGLCCCVPCLLSLLKLPFFVASARFGDATKWDPPSPPQFFAYLYTETSVIIGKSSKPEILSRIAQTKAALTRFKPVWIDKSISLSSKIRLMRFLVTCIFVYACESWILTAELQRRIQAMEMKCYRKILRISYKDHVTNEEVRAKI